MANNRMWLKNRRTGVEVLLAKYYPSTGWYSFGSETLAERLDDSFAQSQDWSMFGGNEWFVLYEVEDPEVKP